MLHLRGLREKVLLVTLLRRLHNMARNEVLHRAAGAVVAMAAMGLVAACETAQSPTGAVSHPLFNIIAGQGLEVCKDGPDGTNATFTVTATGGQILVTSP